jgi:hypothetical protein
VSRHWGASLTASWSHNRTLSRWLQSRVPESIDRREPLCYMKRLKGRVLLLKGGKS